MNSVLIQYPAESLASTLGMDDVRFAEEVRMAAAMKLFDQGRLSSGQAARLAGVGRVEFILSCGKWGVCSFGPWDEDDIRQEFSTALPEPVTQPS
jgi:predicted HTH domain antitoxin